MNSSLHCIAEGCKSVARVRGMCPRHSEQERLGREGRGADHSPLQECAVSHCTLEANARTEGALCDPHYQMKYRGLNPEDRKLRADPSRWDRICWVDGCDRFAHTKSLCKSHYTAARRGRLDIPDELGVSLNPICIIEGCGRISDARSLCSAHGAQIRSGKPVTDIRAWGKYTQLHPCAVDDCQLPAVSRDLCAMHIRYVNEYKLKPAEVHRILSIAQCENPGCVNTEDLRVDHDHATGEVRGRLCNGCNTALGFLGEDPARIMGLVGYLSEPPERLRRSA